MDRFSLDTGDAASPVTIGDGELLATALAGFVPALHRIPTGGRRWDGRSRGGPLSGADADVRAALAESAGLVDTVRIAQVWTRALDAPRRDARDVWLHADLMPGNLLMRDGRLAAVIDLEAVCIGDPAVDLMPAWNLLPAPARQSYRRALEPQVGSQRIITGRGSIAWNCRRVATGWWGRRRAVRR